MVLHEQERLLFHNEAVYLTKNDCIKKRIKSKIKKKNKWKWSKINQNYFHQSRTIFINQN